MAYGYIDTLEKAGATVLDNGQWGDYQGTWLAKVRYQDEFIFVGGNYGSCSGCDAFQAEFDFTYHEHEDESYYNPHDNGYKEGCDQCQEAKRKYVEFGESYLRNPYDYNKLVEETKADMEWDMEAKEKLDWLERNK
jgi:hypothetical protein